MTASPLTPRGTDFCRACAHVGLRSVFDLAEQPLANRLLRSPTEDEPIYPLHLKICPACTLGQVGEFATPDDIFGDYPYLSSMSSSWLGHVKRYALEMYDELELQPDDLVIEIASNDGHLLANFQDRGVRTLGVEPAANVASIANQRGVETTCAFFGRDTAEHIRAEHGVPRLIVANNVLAHVPDLDDFVSGIARLGGPETVVTIENPSLVRLLLGRQFDTIYHEHFSYLSATSVSSLAARHGLTLVKVQKLSTHGGSLRYWLMPADASAADSTVARMLEEEVQHGLRDESLWDEFSRDSRQIVSDLRNWLGERRARGKVVAGYGAAAKGNTLLNAAGAGTADLIAVTDESPEKQGRFLPGSRVPVVAPSDIVDLAPDDVLLLPWNIRTELARHVKALVPDSRCWVAIPSLSQVSV